MFLLLYPYVLSKTNFLKKGDSLVGGLLPNNHWMKLDWSFPNLFPVRRFPALIRPRPFNFFIQANYSNHSNQIRIIKLYVHHSHIIIRLYTHLVYMIDSTFSRIQQDACHSQILVCHCVMQSCIALKSKGKKIEGDEI